MEISYKKPLYTRIPVYQYLKILKWKSLIRNLCIPVYPYTRIPVYFQKLTLKALYICIPVYQSLFRMEISQKKALYTRIPVYPYIHIYLTATLFEQNTVYKYTCLPIPKSIMTPKSQAYTCLLYIDQKSSPFFLKKSRT